MTKKQRQDLEACQGIASEIESRQIVIVFHPTRNKWIPLSPKETHELATSGFGLRLGPAAFAAGALNAYQSWLERHPNVDNG